MICRCGCGLETKTGLKQGHGMRLNGIIPPSRKGVKYSVEIRKTFGSSMEKHPSWKGGVGIYSKLVKKELCSICKSTNTRLMVHHIDKNRHNNSIKNLQVVCYKCHNNVCHGDTMYGRSSD